MLDEWIDKVIPGEISGDFSSYYDSANYFHCDIKNGSLF